MSHPQNAIVIVSGTVNGPGAIALQAAARAAGCKASIVAPDDKDVTDAITQASHVIYRLGPKSYPLFVALLEKLRGVARVELNNVLRAFDKRDTFTILASASIPIPASWLIRSDEEFAGKTFVIKIPKGNQGRGVELIHNQGELDAFFAAYEGETEFLAQEFISEARAKDKRLFVVGNRVIAAMQRTSTSDDFRANLHLGGEGQAYTPTNEEQTMALQSIKAFGLKYGGVDIIDSNRGPLVLEVNPSPGFGISEITGVNVTYEVIKSLVGAKND
jgi:ribosomal protein S6--L-glutamate ligase